MDGQQNKEQTEHKKTDTLEHGEVGPESGRHTKDCRAVRKDGSFHT